MFKKKKIKYKKIWINKQKIINKNRINYLKNKKVLKSKFDEIFFIKRNQFKSRRIIKTSKSKSQRT